MKLDKFVPKCGDVVWIDLDPQSGHEQAGRRSALVLSPQKYNQKVGLAIFCPLTKHIKGYPFEVIIPETNIISGAILADHVKNLDWRARNVEFICKLPDKIIVDVLKKLGTLISFKTGITKK
ncbi:MAG: type II toxin-antitoxin system PemK/MazF family toxin [Candidatus Anammoxibacter sp.]